MRLVLLTIAALAATSASAQTIAPPPSAAAVDPAALAAARRVLDASDLRATMRTTAPELADAAIALARSTFKDSMLPDGLMARLQEVMRREMPALVDVYTPEAIAAIAPIYARTFTVGELNRIADLLGDPAMMKFRQQAPVIMRETMPIVMAAMAPRQAAFQKAVMQAVADWVREHPADRAKLARPLAT